MTEFIQVSTTVDSFEAAQKIAHSLVEQKLAACVQIVGPIESVYSWQDKMEQSQEWICQAKSKSDSFREVESAIRALHSYDCPEIIATPLVAASADYLQWLRNGLE